MESFQRKKQRGNHPPLLLQLAHAQQKPNHQYLLKASSDAKPTGFWDGWKCGFPSHYSCIQYTCLPRTHLFMSWSKVRSLRNMLFPMPPLWGTLASLWLQGITIPPIQTSLSSPSHSREWCTTSIFWSWNNILEQFLHPSILYLQNSFLEKCNRRIYEDY